jgi:competence protein ComEA
MRITARPPAGPQHGGMDEIVVGGGWRDRIEELVGRRQDVRVLAGIIAALVLLALVLWSRGSEARIAPPARAPGPELTATPVAGILVHVAGAVRTPGLYEFPDGARVADAIESAGGPRKAADLGALNLAQVLTDGLKVSVPRRGEATAIPGETATEEAAVSVNAADEAALETIPGIGPVKAAAIVAYRTEHGPFGSVEELIEVTGIGPATLEALRPYVTL